MPWQRLVADVGFEIDPDTGLMAYREVVVTVMRQNGKTHLVLTIEVERCIIWEEPQHVIYTAQTGSDARVKLLEDQVPILERHMGKYVRRVYRAKGEETISFKNGSRIELTASSKKSGHGGTIDLGILDEMWADDDNRREQAILPMMNTRPNAQMLICSTQGTDESIPLNRITERGRLAATKNRGSGTAYFEWSLPAGCDHENPELWWEHMPALGWTITEAAVRHGLETMDLAEWLRAYGNQQTTSTLDRIIPVALWAAVVDRAAAVDRSRPVRFGVDVLPDRSAASIVASDGKTVEFIDRRDGTGWIAQRMQDLIASWGGTAVIDAGGPAASIGDELELLKLPVQRLTNAEVAVACARMFDAIADRTITIRASQPLDDAASVVARKPVGDRFVWSRSASLGDITPLFAATLAFGAPVAAPRVPMLAYT